MLARILIAACLVASVSAQTEVFSNENDISERILTGTIVAEGGRPIASASVAVRRHEPTESRLIGYATTESDGRFRVVVEPPPRDGYMRNAFIEVQAQGFASSHLEHIYLPPPIYDVGEIVLYAPVQVRGSVVSADGKPIVGAEIHAALGPALAPYGDHARRAPIAVTNGRGVFECRSLAPGLVTLGASANGFADRASPAVMLRSDAPNELTFTLDPERRVAIRVTGADGSALAGALALPLGIDASHPPYEKQSRYRAFWRAAEHADAQGTIAVRGLDADFAGQVLITAEDHEPELASLTDDGLSVKLRRVRWIDVIASSADGAAPCQLYMVQIRDVTRPSSWCGNCEDTRWARLCRDSDAVEVLAPNHWRIAWNSPGCYVDGGRPSQLSAELTNGLYSHADLPDDFKPGSHTECRLKFDKPARLSGTVRDEFGKPVSVRLGVQLSMYRSDWLSVVSDSDGRFDFHEIDGGPQWIYALDPHWELTGSPRVELEVGGTLENVVVGVRARSGGRTGVVRGTVLISGKPPAAPILLALDEVPDQHLPDAYPRGFAWTDRDGHFEIGSFWPRDYHILAKHRPAAPGGGWRDFASEFPAHGSDWPWTVSVPESGVAHASIHFPAEAEWDSIAPPKSD